MAELSKNLKNIWMKSMQAIGNTASNIASNTKYKVDEMNLLNRKREILNDFGAKAYALWQKGVVFPPELQDQLCELSQLDEKLNDMRAEKFSGISGEHHETEDPQAAAAEENVEDREKPYLSEAINELFQEPGSSEKAAGIHQDDSVGGVICPETEEKKNESSETI